MSMRFIYRESDIPDIAPPHMVWDTKRGAWARMGSFSSRAEATAAAVGMNVVAEEFDILGRVCRSALADIKRLERSLEQMLVNMKDAEP